MFLFFFVVFINHKLKKKPRHVDLTVSFLEKPEISIPYRPGSGSLGQYSTTKNGEKTNASSSDKEDDDEEYSYDDSQSDLSDDASQYNYKNKDNSDGESDSKIRVKKEYTTEGKHKSLVKRRDSNTVSTPSKYPTEDKQNDNGDVSDEESEYASVQSDRLLSSPSSRERKLKKREKRDKRRRRKEKSKRKDSIDEEEEEEKEEKEEHENDKNRLKSKSSPSNVSTNVNLKRTNREMSIDSKSSSKNQDRDVATIPESETEGSSHQHHHKRHRSIDPQQQHHHNFSALASPTIYSSQSDSSVKDKNDIGGEGQRRTSSQDGGSGRIVSQSIHMMINRHGETPSYVPSSISTRIPSNNQHFRRGHNKSFSQPINSHLYPNYDNNESSSSHQRLNNPQPSATSNVTSSRLQQEHLESSDYRNEYYSGYQYNNSQRPQQQPPSHYSHYPPLEDRSRLRIESILENNESSKSLKNVAFRYENNQPSTSLPSSSSSSSNMSNFRFPGVIPNSLEPPQYINDNFARPYHSYALSGDNETGNKTNFKTLSSEEQRIEFEYLRLERDWLNVKVKRLEYETKKLKRIQQKIQHYEQFKTNQSYKDNGENDDQKEKGKAKNILVLPEDEKDESKNNETDFTKETEPIQNEESVKPEIGKVEKQQQDITNSEDVEMIHDEKNKDEKETTTMTPAVSSPSSSNKPEEQKMTEKKEKEAATKQTEKSTSDEKEQNEDDDTHSGNISNKSISPLGSPSILNETNSSFSSKLVKAMIESDKQDAQNTFSNVKQDESKLNDDDDFISPVDKLDDKEDEVISSLHKLRQEAFKNVNDESMKKDKTRLLQEAILTTEYKKQEAAYQYYLYKTRLAYLQLKDYEKNNRPNDNNNNNDE